MKQIPKGRRRRFWTDWNETWWAGSPGGETGSDQTPLASHHSLDRERAKPDPQKSLRDSNYTF